MLLFIIICFDLQSFGACSFCKLCTFEYGSEASSWTWSTRISTQWDLRLFFWLIYWLQITSRSKTLEIALEKKTIAITFIICRMFRNFLYFFVSGWVKFQKKKLRFKIAKKCKECSFFLNLLIFMKKSVWGWKICKN